MLKGKVGMGWVLYHLFVMSKVGRQQQVRDGGGRELEGNQSHHS
jgi:hypothetical protein